MGTGTAAAQVPVSAQPLQTVKSGGSFLTSLELSSLIGKRSSNNSKVLGVRICWVGICKLEYLPRYLGNLFTPVAMEWGLLSEG